MDSERDAVMRGGGGEDRVERAVAAMCRVEAPEVPAGLEERTIVRTGGGGGSGGLSAARAGLGMGSQKKGWWSMKMVRRTAVAAALAVAVGAGALLVPWGGMGARVAFADVVEQVKAAKLVTCKVDMELTVAGQQQRKMTLAMVMSEDGVASMTMGSTRVMVNEATGRMMLIDDARKQVTVMDRKKQPGPANAPNLLTVFKDIPSEGKPLGEKVVDGRKTKGFAVEQGKKHFEVWADETTEKPVRVEMRVTEAGMPELHFTFRDFDWNPEEVAAIKFEAPAGYQEVKARFNMTGLQEQDLVEMLKTDALLNNGVLPEKVDMGSVLMVVRRWAEAHGGANSAASQEDLMQKMMPVGRGWAFMGDETKGSEWTYGGAGVKAGEKGKPVLWYRPPGGDTWRVIDADWSVHEQPEAPAGGQKVRTDMGALLGAETQPGK
jgi:hypothetical protein